MALSLRILVCRLVDEDNDEDEVDMVRAGVCVVINVVDVVVDGEEYVERLLAGGDFRISYGLVLQPSSVVRL